MDVPAVSASSSSIGARGRSLDSHIVGERAVEVAQIAAIAMTGGLKIDDVARLPLSFPTYTNVFGRAALRAVRMFGDRTVIEP